MASYLKSTRDFLYRRRKPFIVVGGIVGGVYMVANYAISKITEVQTRMVEERRDRENLRRRFDQNQEDCNFTILALLPTLGDQLFSHMDVEGLTAKLQRGRQSPSGDESASLTNASKATEKPNGIVDVSDSTVLASQHPTQQVSSSQEAMEEIWTKLDPAKEKQNGALTNGTHSEEQGPEQKVKGNSEGEVREGVKMVERGGTDEMPNGDGQAIGEHRAMEGNDGQGEKTSTVSGLDTISEPAPLPIPRNARLSLSPSPTPSNGEEVKEADKSDAGDPTTLEQQKVQPPQGNGVAEAVPLVPSNAESFPPAQAAKTPSQEELLAEKKEKLALWNELKITAFSRTLTTLYSLVLLSLQTHIQLNLLGRYAYLTSVASLSAQASTATHQIRLERNDGGQEQELEDEEGAVRDEDDVKGIDLQTERLYLTFSWWFLHQGWKELAEEVQGAVEEVVGGLALKSQLTHQDFVSLLNKIRRRVEYEHRDEGATSAFDVQSEWSEATAATTSRKRGKRRTFLSVLFPPPSEEVGVLEKAGAIPAGSTTIRTVADLSPNLSTLLDETKDLLESKDFARILRLSLNRIFDVFEQTLRPTFQVEPSMTTAEVDKLLRQSSAAAEAAAAAAIATPGATTSTQVNQTSRFQQLTDDGHAGIRVRLASLFPAVARQSSAAINGVPNEYVEALTDIKELKAFSAVIYSSWS